MKNIHLIPTNKPSRLFIHNAFNDLRFDSKNVLHDNNQNIYITSDEEIKANEWFYSPKTNSPQIYGHNDIPKDRGFKKIILTTDQDLIKNSVQAIDEEFLEWFVNNAGCEEVKILRCPIEGYTIDLRELIPKEEPKQEQIQENHYDRNSLSYSVIKEEPITNLEKLPFPELVKEFKEFAEYNKNVSLVEEPKEECPCFDECMSYSTKKCKNLLSYSVIKEETLEDIAEQIQNECHKFVESMPNINYQNATNVFLFMKLAELTLKIKNYER